MLLIEQVYIKLSECDLVETAEDFSRDWCGKSRSWYAERRHNKRDFSVTAAINCIEAINLKRALLSMRGRRFSGLLEVEIRELGQLQEDIQTYLAEQHRITEVALSKTPRSQLLEK
ncbi:DUF6626 family protein [Ruegeria sp. HKCCD7221]|uniref:DUF6626 family protein n=1 Tax=Ruegeria sp. HKCCD7221 TaxID=2683009 RepID=UPI0014878014|nr:DUF6626 family protein [Ruegeria sp. HKCCD7221]